MAFVTYWLHTSKKEGVSTTFIELMSHLTPKQWESRGLEERTEIISKVFQQN